MRYLRKSGRSLVTFNLLVLLAMPTPNASSQANVSTNAVGGLAAAIKIKQPPRRGEGEDETGLISGAANGVDFDKCKVVIFARTNRWYVQPFVATPYTQIDSDGNWQADIHLGHEYAALLVRNGYKPPATANILPQVGGNVLAIDRCPPSK